MFRTTLLINEGILQVISRPKIERAGVFEESVLHVTLYTRGKLIKHESRFLVEIETMDFSPVELALHCKKEKKKRR